MCENDDDDAMMIKAGERGEKKGGREEKE